MSIVLDASVVLTWALPEERNQRGEELLALCVSTDSVVPALFPTELTNALLMAERRKRITAEEIEVFLRIFRSYPVRVHATRLADVGRILDLARTESLTGYDAAYLDLAQSLDLPLATFDEAMRRAAKRRGVRLA